MPVVPVNVVAAAVPAPAAPMVYSVSAIVTLSPLFNAATVNVAVPSLLSTNVPFNPAS